MEETPERLDRVSSRSPGWTTSSRGCAAARPDWYGLRVTQRSLEDWAAR